MVRLYHLILILLFFEFRADLVVGSKSSEEISAIIQSYADAFTTVAPEKTKYVTTNPNVEAEDPEYLHDLTKAKYDNKSEFSNVPLDAAGPNAKSISSEEFSSTFAQESNESEEPEGLDDSLFLKREGNIPEEAQHVKTEFDPTIEGQDHEYGHNSIKAKYGNNPALSNAPLVAAASNQYARFKDFSSGSVEESNESYEPRGPADHVIPFSEHENPKEPSTRPNYTAPGVWAKPPPDRNIPLEFLPTKLLAQVRDSHTVKHVPREYALESAETSEEKENAARLKEVLKESKANTIYTEEGYEDAAYDHAGHIRDADFQEDFARKLNEELELKKPYFADNQHPKVYKSHKPRKHNNNNHAKFLQNNKNPSKVIKGTNSKEKVSPKHYRLLKSALSQPVINPKLTVENGLVELEKDLRNEYREGQRTSTEQYIYTTTPMPITLKSPATKSVFQSKMDFETTTMRQNIFTVRPRKTVIKVTPKPHRNKFKKPLNVFSVSQNIDNYNAYTTSAYNHEPTQLPSTIDYGKSVWEYIRDNQNITPSITYPPHFQQQAVNPLAVATVNGHGPYLVVVTASPDTSDSQNLVSTIGYGAVNDYNVTQPIVLNSNVQHNTYAPVNRQANRVNYIDDQHAGYTNTDVLEPTLNKRGKTKHRDKTHKLKKLKPQPSSESSPIHIEENRDSYMDYYTQLQSSKIPVVPHSSYNRLPNTNWFNQWPEIFDNVKPVESYGPNDFENLPMKLKNPRGVSLVTRILPPAPLSASEYATFQRQNREIKPMAPTVMEMMPIIDAIHKRERERNSFPFLFRRKRSTSRFFRSPNFKPTETNNREINENLRQNSNKSNNTKYPANFQSLLNESPHIATKEVDAEIKRHFKNDTKSISEKPLFHSPEELASDKNTSGSKEDFKDNETVEVQVPELDFISVFQKDEIGTTTQEPRIDTKKYPFYTDSSALRNTALKYIINPKDVPKKTLGGMEFYDSRVRECEEVNPDLDKIVPEDEEIVNKRGPQKKKSRLHGLGDKIDCYKAKYFDEIPLDNPLFIEKDVEMPPPPEELNPKQFASRILELPESKEEYTILKGPKNPEFMTVMRAPKVSRPPRPHVSELNTRHHLHKKMRNPHLVNTNQQRYRYAPSVPVSIDGRMKPPETRSKMKIKASNLKVIPRYQRLVYEDVMGTIMNLDNSKKSHVPKRGNAPFYSKHYKGDNNRDQGTTGSKKVKSVPIDGLVPPPKKVTHTLINNMHRHNFTDIPTTKLRIHKRSTLLKDNPNLSSAETNDTDNKKDKSAFRIILTTPLPRNTFSENQTSNSDKINTSVISKKYNDLNHSPRHSNRSAADSGRYGKFSTSNNVNSSFVTRRKEPKYNVAEKFSLPNRTTTLQANPTYASSTSIPVMVNLYENFTARIPRGSKNKQAKQQVDENPDHDKHSSKLKELDSKIDPSNKEEEEEEDPKKQFVVFNPVKGKTKNKSNDSVVTTDKPKEVDVKFDPSNEQEEDPKKQFVVFDPKVKVKKKPNEAEVTTNAPISDSEIHKELEEFLKGNPPGYDEAFTEKVDHFIDKNKELYKVKDENSDVKESLNNEKSGNDNYEAQESPKNEENDDEIPESETEDAELDEQKKEVYEEETPYNDSPEEVEKNVQSSDDEEKSPHDDQQEDKPFVRFSSRPESPPENFEDERYADLGPRINKPYFYHPPFDVPTYEKYALGRSIEHDGDDYGHEETEYHKKYAFPWEHDDEKDESKEESEHYAALDRYEYPWEKREREKKEREKREKIHEKYGKKDFIPNYDNDSYGKASNVDFTYISSKNKHLRGKKDVNALQNDPENYSSKFSSKYKSAKIKDPKTDEKNADDIDKSIKKYIKNIEISTPKDVKDHVSENITSNVLNNNTSALIIDSNIKKSLTALSSSKVEGVDRIISTTASSANRSRGRTRRVSTISNKRNETVLSDVTNLPDVQPTLSSKIIRQRGRNRNSATILTPTTATTSTVKPSQRKRSRQVSTTTTIRTTPKSVNEKRRRAFRITSYPSNGIESTTLSTIPTSTGRTVQREHRSRVSKEMIITKTVEDNDSDDLDEDSDKNISSRGNKKFPSNVAEISRSKIRHRQKTKSMPYNQNPMKTERVEKVTITMEETPDHVYETKEIDKDGIKGKFITITANNNSDKAVPTKHNRGRAAVVDDAEMEEMERKMEAFKSFDSVIHDSESLGDEPGSLRTAEKYLVGSLLQKLPLPLSRKLTPDREDSEAENDNDDSEDGDNEEDQSEEYDDVDDNDEDVDENSDEIIESEDISDKKSNETLPISNNTKIIENNPSVIKDPNNRNYYYVETP